MKVVMSKNMNKIEVTLGDDQLNRPTMADGIVTKQRAQKRKLLEKKLNENTAKMNIIKKKLEIVYFYVFQLVNKKNLTNMSYIQLPYGYVGNNKQVQYNLPNNYKESFYLKEVPHLTNQNPAIEKNLLNLIRNRDDLKKWLITPGKKILELLLKKIINFF